MGQPETPVLQGQPAPWRLFLASFLSLYIELLLIRWIPSAVHVVGFFNGLVLIGCFLGLGLGMVKAAPAADTVTRALFRFGVVVALLVTFGSIRVTVLLPDGGEYAANEGSYIGAPNVPMAPVLLAVFIAVVWATIPFGQLVGSYIDTLNRMPAYTINIAGSLVGVLGFTLVSWFELHPLIWFSAGLGLTCLLHPRWKHGLPIALVLASLTVQHLHMSRWRHVVAWSPYYKIVVLSLTDSKDLNDGFVMLVNDQGLLFSADYSDKGSPSPEMKSWWQRQKAMYDLPYNLHPHNRVLVLGAGTGNDVAAALRNGVPDVTAVEIDPAVLRLGKQLHPERPYDSERVRIVCDDARAFLRPGPDTFDLVIFATLDAHGLISRAGNVRLDSFIYTRESFAAVRDHLSDDGHVVLYLGPFREEVAYRLYHMLRDVFQRDPLYYDNPAETGKENRGHFFITGKGPLPETLPVPSDWRRVPPSEVEEQSKKFPYATRLATDDWPYLLMQKPRVPVEYLTVLAGVLVIALVTVGLSFRGTTALDGHFFFMGAGFLLLETKSITELARLVGSTWQVNSLVFTVILLVILLANWMVTMLWRDRWLWPCYGLLAVFLVASYVWPLGSIAGAHGSANLALAGLYVGVPIFLVASIFAATFRHAPVAAVALASNLLGSVLGGTTEYLSLAFGIRTLSLLALGMYAASFVCLALRKRAKIA